MMCFIVYCDLSFKLLKYYNISLKLYVSIFVLAHLFFDFESFEIHRKRNILDHFRSLKLVIQIDELLYNNLKLDLKLQKIR
jgi:hypothetical protein